VKLEGDESTTRTLRRIWDEYYDVQVGDYTIGGFDLFRFRPGTSIGRYCSISRTARTETGNHPMNTLSTNAFFFNPAKNFTSAEFVPRVRLRIGNDVFLGHNVHVIAPTQEIGDGAVLGSGSIVMGNVPPFAVMMGYPAHVVRYRFSKDAIEEILKNPWWEKDLDELAAVKDEFTRPVEGKEVR
jgi:acetyltransferase-like isoleucine patch superfamily enzyme